MVASAISADQILSADNDSADHFQLVLLSRAIPEISYLQHSHRPAIRESSNQLAIMVSGSDTVVSRDGGAGKVRLNHLIQLIQLAK